MLVGVSRDTKLTVAMQATPSDEPSIIHCGECGAQLAHDQRYCLECGVRRGPLPRQITQLIGAIHEQGRRISSPGRPEGEPLIPDRSESDAWIIAPRAAAVAVIGMLGFGVVVGSLVTGSVAGVVRPLLVAVLPHSSAPVGVSGGEAGGGASASGGSASSGGSAPSSAGGSAASQTASSSAPSSSSSGSSTGTSLAPSSLLPPVKHVFMIVLSGQGYSQTFGNTVDDPYLARTLTHEGELIPTYYAVAGGPLSNEIALVSGQGPTRETVTDCPVYKNIVPAAKGARDQVLGTGCVYPKTTKTLADQLTAAHLTWKAYVQTNATGKQANQAACKHPKLGNPDASLPSAKNPDVTWRNPFLYFHSLIDESPCPKNDVGLDQLAGDLKTANTAPALSYIIPDVCDDGSDVPCAPNASSGMAAADAFLKSVVPEIKRSPAYKADGLIAITFDNAPQTGPYADPSSCCDNPTYPNLPSSGGATGNTGTTGTTTTGTATTTTGTTGTTTTGTTTTTTGTTTTGTTTTGTTTTGPSATSPSLGSGQSNPTGGGGQVGLLLISQYVKPASLDVTDYFNHFSLLASLEDVFGLKRLGYASDPALPVFGAAVYTNYAG